MTPFLATCLVFFLLALLGLIRPVHAATPFSDESNPVASGPVLDEAAALVDAAPDPLAAIRGYMAEQGGPVSAYDVAAAFSAPADPTFGAEEVFNPANTTHTSVTALDATHVVVAYRDDGNSDHGTAVVGTVSGTTITFGAEVVFNPATTVYNSVTALDATTFVVAYQDFGNSGHGTAVVGELCDPLVVTNTSDSGCGSLREAINAANSMGGTDTITFDIDGAGPHTIQPASALPEITEAVIIDGATQPGNADVCTNPIPTRPDYAIVLDGTGSSFTALILDAGSDGSTIRGLNIRNFAFQGILILGNSSGNTVACNFIGTSEDGISDMGNGQSGVHINSGTKNIIGTDGDGTNDANEGNVISGNTQDGVHITGATSTDNVVAGNYIGLDATGEVALGNARYGVWMLSGTSGNVIGTNADGTSDTEERNVISANARGVVISSPSTQNNTIAGNYIGTDKDGDTDLGNGQGVNIFDASNNTVGGTTAAARNVISGNDDFAGVFIGNGSPSGNVVLGNYIGTDATGEVALPNSGGAGGVWLDNGATGNYIGAMPDGLGGLTYAGNVISGNTNQGIRLEDAGTDGNVIVANLIGTDKDGETAIPNGNIGILNWFGVDDTVIGGSDPAARNVISGNGGTAGLWIIGSGTGSSNNLVTGNYIGTDITGTQALGNSGSGIILSDNAASNVIGGLTDATRNVISGNSDHGVWVAGTGSTAAAEMADLEPQVMPNPDGSLPAPALAAYREASSQATMDNAILGNFIGTDATGTVAMGNDGNGIRVEAVAVGTLIGALDNGGGSLAVNGNVVSGNSGSGVAVLTGSINTVIVGNRIGTDAGGTSALANDLNGVQIDGAPSNEIGGTGAGEGNTIAFNGEHGVVVVGDASLQNALLSNSIFENTLLGIDLGADGVTANDDGDLDASPNKLQNWPVVTTVTDAGGGNFDVTYLVDTDPANATYPLRVEFFSGDVDEEEGQTFIGFDTYTAGDFATGEKTVTLTPGGAFAALVATATDDDGNTSEFSVPLPVLTALKTFTLSEGDDGIAQPGETVSYTITITNDGSGSTSGLTFSDDALDGSLALACATVVPVPDTCTDGLGGSFSYNAGTLAELGILGDMVTITFDALVENPISVGVEEVSNQGTASGDNFEDVLTDDPNDPTSDADPTIIPVEAAAVVMATKTDALVIDLDGDGGADPGDTIEYTITVTNTGDQDVADVLVTDTVDPNTELECPVSPGVGTQVSCTPGAGGSFVVDLTTIDGELRLLTPKASEALTFRVVLVSPFPAGTGTVENQATVAYTGEGGLTQMILTDDPDTPAPIDPTVTEIDLSADLLLTKTASMPTPDYLSNVVFTLTLDNLGPANGASAEVKDALPKGLVFVSATGDGSYNPDTGRWDVAGIDVGTPVSIQITVRVETTEPITNTATITKARLRDENPSNNSASATITPVASDLHLEKRLTAYTEDASVVTATFTLTATNEGPSTATGVVVTDLLDDDATLISTQFSDATDTYNATTGVWTIGTLDVGETATLVMTLTADARAFVLNYAEIAGNEPDQNGRNNVSAVVIGRDIPDPGRFRSDISLTKTVSEANPPLGSQVVYTLTATNGGPFTTAGVEVTDLLPAGVSFVSASMSDDSDAYDAETGVWLVGALPDGAVAQLQITVEVTGSGEIVNTAEVTSNHLPDPDSQTGNGNEDEDDQASATITVGGIAGEKATDTEASASVPTEYTLYGNYPNPFNPQTTIPYGVPSASAVRLAVYDLLGREVAVLVEGTVSAGRYEVVWEAGAHPTGLYLVRMEAEGHVVTRRITLMK